MAIPAILVGLGNNKILTRCQSIRKLFFEYRINADRLERVNWVEIIAEYLLN